MLLSYDFPPNPYCYLPYSSFPFSLYFPPVNLPNYLLHYFSHSSLCSICILKFLFLLSTNNFLQPVFELAGIFFPEGVFLETCCYVFHIFSCVLQLQKLFSPPPHKDTCLFSLFETGFKYQRLAINFRNSCFGFISTLIFLCETYQLFMQHFCYH